MYKKKISTIAIITILTLTTLLAAIPMASAIDVPALTDSFMGFPVTGGYCYSFIDVSGTGATPFGLVEVYWDTLATKLGDGYADSAGAYDIEMIIIPFDVIGLHDVIVFDVLSSDTNFATYDIIPLMFPSVSQALPGDSVMILGSGFGGELDVGLYLGAITSVVAESVTITPGVSVTGTLAETPVVITTVDIATDVTITGLVGGDPIVAGGALDISVTDDGEGNLAGTADVPVDDGVVTFSGVVTVTLTGTINYATGAITLTASGVDEGSGDPVTDIVVTIDACDADYDYAEYEITPPAGVTTGDDGSFQESIIVPAIAEVDYGDYDVTAIDTDGNVNVPWFIFPSVLTIDYYIELTPDSGPTGITITIDGRIKANTAYELRFNTIPFATGTSGADGSYEGTYTIPAVLPVGTYPVDVVWDVTESRTADFDVTDPPQVVYAPIAAVAGEVVTISTVAGFPFSTGADIELYLGTTLVNSTAMDDRFGPTGGAGPGAGTFTDLEFTVPALTPGPYALKVIDEYGASTAAIYTFTVLPTPVTTVTLRGTLYYPCCTLSFNIFTTETDLGTITVTIRDPTGAIWWTTSAWTLSGVVTKSVYYQDQLFGVAGDAAHAKLPLDAPLGSWNWTVTYTPTSTAVLTKATGLFTVAAEPGMQTVIDAIDDCCANLTALLDALDAKIVAIDDAIATIEIPDLGTIQASLTSLDATITGLDGDIATIKTSVGGVTTSLASIDAVVGSMYGDVVTINTTLGVIEGTLMDMDGTLATIETDLGTVQLDVAAIETNVDEALPVTVDMLPMWIAVILSLIAAIAAIFAVITIRQKIAG